MEVRVHTVTAGAELDGYDTGKHDAPRARRGYRYVAEEGIYEHHRRTARGFGNAVLHAARRVCQRRAV